MIDDRTKLTAEDLFCLPDDGQRHELVRGELRTMPPAGGIHGIVASRLDHRVRTHVEQGELGEVFGAETGFRIFHAPDTVRAPDLAYVASSRLPDESALVAFPALAPDLVAEVVSPGDTATEVHEKVEEWLEAGVRLVWLLYPARRTVIAYRSHDEIKILSEIDELDGADVLPGFSCKVRDLFPQSPNRAGG